jgi:DNA-binding MarR family transcriptional regulator
MAAAHGGLAMTDDDRPDVLIERCSRALHRAARLAKPQGSEWLALDLGMGQLKAIGLLTERRQSTVGGLAKAIGISEPSASILVDKLVQRGLVARETDPADRRRTLVIPTEAGDGLMERLRQIKDDRVRAWLALMPERDVQALLQGLDALGAAIEQERGRA